MRTHRYVAKLWRVIFVVGELRRELKRFESLRELGRKPRFSRCCCWSNLTSGSQKWYRAVASGLLIDFMVDLSTEPPHLRQMAGEVRGEGGCL